MRIRQFLLIGIFGSLMVGIGEWLLHYTASGPVGEISMLFSVPLHRASLGHFIAIAFAPLYFVGYYGVKKYLDPISEPLARSIFFLGVISFFIGGIWISSRYFGAVVFQKSQNTDAFAFFLEQYEDHYHVLVWVLRISISLISALYVYLIAFNKIGFSKWLTLNNPILLLALCISSLIWFKPLGIHIAPIAMNVAHFIFFLVLYLNCKK